MPSEEQAPVGLDTLLAGYDQAYQRWMTGPRIATDEEQAFIAIFEALNWAVAIDDRFRKTERSRDRWSIGYAQGDTVLGFRYARNAVHHDWADALYVNLGGFYLPSPLPAPLFEWCWRPRLRSTNPRNRAEYAAHLAEKPIRFTLEALKALYAQAAADVAPGP